MKKCDKALHECRPKNALTAFETDVSFSFLNLWFDVNDGCFAYSPSSWNVQFTTC